jgi:hypothetical protein
MQHHRLNRAQRVATVAALGFALYLLGAWVTSLGLHLPYGSATYTNVGTSIGVGGLYPWVRFIIWMLLIAAWVGASIPLLRGHSMEQRGGFSS